MMSGLAQPRRVMSGGIGIASLGDVVEHARQGVKKGDGGKRQEF